MIINELSSFLNAKIRYFYGKIRYFYGIENRYFYLKVTVKIRELHAEKYKKWRQTASKLLLRRHKKHFKIP